LASVPSGGSGGGSAPAASGGAAAGGAAPEEDKKEEKEEGMFSELQARLYVMFQQLIVLCHREGRVRRGYGFRSFRLIASHSKLTLAITYKIWQILSEGPWEKLCKLSVVLHGRGLVNRDKVNESLLLCQLDTATRRASSTFLYLLCKLCIVLAIFKLGETVNW
jgi:hypothetical protein